MTRREFLSSSVAFASLPVSAADSGGVRLKLGVLSDIHVGGEYPKDWNEFMHFNVMTFLRALRLLYPAHTMHRAIYVMFILPPPFVLPVFADDARQRTFVSAVLSVSTLIAIAGFCALAILRL